MSTPVKVRAKATDSRAARRKFFSRPLTTEYAQELAALLAQAPDAAASGEKDSYLAFRLGGGRFAISARKVQSVSQPMPICRLPQYVDSAFLGLAAVDGEVMPCVSLAKLMAIEHTEDTKSRRVIVLEERAGERWAFVADEVLAVLTGAKDEQDAEGVPAEVAEEWRERVLQGDGGPVVLLRAETIFQAMASAVA